MKDISVQEIIKTFKGVKRKNILSTAQTDDFLTAIKEKKNWTLKEFKELSLAYDLEYRISKIMDFMQMSRIQTTHNFKFTWTDYFKVLDNIKSKTKQKQYINYYIWYYNADMTEAIFKKLMSKPYFEYLSTKSKVNFLGKYLQTDNSKKWVNKYFSPEELKKALKGLKNFAYYIQVCEKPGKYDIDKENQVKQFYNQYEHLIKNQAKLRFFYQVIESGSLNLIEFFYKEKKIKNINKLHLFWHVCREISAGNVVEVLTLLKDLGMKFSQQDIVNAQEHANWNYMEYKSEILHFFKILETEKKYNELKIKLANSIKSKMKSKKI